MIFFDAVVEFAVDPQDEADRRESRLAVIADHLGFSWSGKSILSFGSICGFFLSVYFIFCCIYVFNVEMSERNCGN